MFCWVVLARIDWPGGFIRGASSHISPSYKSDMHYQKSTSYGEDSMLHEEHYVELYPPKMLDFWRNILVHIF